MPLQKALCNLAHLMGASVRKDISGSVTHVVAHSVSGSRYKVHIRADVQCAYTHCITGTFVNGGRTV